jgi:hypothetical protein
VRSQAVQLHGQPSDQEACGLLLLLLLLLCRTQATLDARREADSPKAPQGPPAAGCYPHAQPFMWPAPRDPQMYNQHALKPSGYRCD